MLRLPVAVLVPDVGRAGRDADGEEGQQRGDESVPECTASESRPRLPVAMPAPSLSATSAGRGDDRHERCSALRIIRAEGWQPERARLRRALLPDVLGAYELVVGDVAAEALLEDRPGAVALVAPVVELEALGLGVYSKSNRQFLLSM